MPIIFHMRFQHLLMNLQLDLDLVQVMVYSSNMGYYLGVSLITRLVGIFQDIFL